MHTYIADVYESIKEHLCLIMLESSDPVNINIGPEGKRVYRNKIMSQNKDNQNNNYEKDRQWFYNSTMILQYRREGKIQMTSGNSDTALTKACSNIIS